MREPSSPRFTDRELMPKGTWIKKKRNHKTSKAYTDRDFSALDEFETQPELGW